MKKNLFLLTLVSLAFASSPVFADYNPNRVLRCKNTAGSLSIPSCGGTAGCIATVTTNPVVTDTGTTKKIKVKYSVNRSRNKNGSFTYRPRPKSTLRCTIKLNVGNTQLISVSCSPGLATAACNIS